MKIFNNKRIIDNTCVIRFIGINYYNCLGRAIAYYSIEVNGDGNYYHIIDGYSDIYSPHNDIEAIGSLDKLIDWIDLNKSEGGCWYRDKDLLDHVEKALATVAN